jgi:hypothetical protein
MASGSRRGQHSTAAAMESGPAPSSPGDGEHGEHYAAVAMESRKRRGWPDGCEGGAEVGGPRVRVTPFLGAERRWGSLTW